MAENPEETPIEEAETTAAPEADAGEATPETTEASAAAAGAESSEPESAEPAAPEQTRRERNASAREAKKDKGNAPRTLEERLAERAAHRERNARQRRAYRAKLKAKRAATREAAGPSEELHAPEHGPGRAKVRQGIVVSDKGDKSITVRIDVARRHKRYHKIMRSSTTFQVHDESNSANVGDTVRVQECRPMSRSKRWRLLEILERAR